MFLYIKSGKRRKKVKIVGRRIVHKGEEDDGSETSYTGTVLSVAKTLMDIQILLTKYSTIKMEKPMTYTYFS